MPNNNTEVDINAYVNTSLVDIVTQKIRANIFSGKYEPGKKLIVREISEELGVSHTPVKDALNRLISESFLESLPRKSVVVRQYSNDELIDNLHIRCMLELFAVNGVVRALKNDKTILKQMKNDLDMMCSSAGQNKINDYEKWIKYEELFHSRYMNTLENKAYIKMYAALNSNRVCYFAHLQGTGFPLTYQRFLRNTNQHNDIIEALEGGEKTQIAAALAAHIISCAEDATEKHKKEKIDEMREMTKLFIEKI